MPLNSKKLKTEDPVPPPEADHNGLARIVDLPVELLALINESLSSANKRVLSRVCRHLRQFFFPLAWESVEIYDTPCTTPGTISRILVVIHST